MMIKAKDEQFQERTNFGMNTKVMCIIVPIEYYIEGENTFNQNRKYACNRCPIPVYCTIRC